MKGLIEDTLLENTGSVSLTIIQDGAEFKIERSKANNHQPKITYPNGDTQSVSPKELRDLFPAVVYSQGELSEVGKHTGEGAPLSELLQFVNPKYKEEDDRLATDVESAKSTVRSAIQAVEDYWRLQATLRRLTTNRDSLRQRIEALEKTLPTLSDEDQAAVQFYDQATEFETKRVQASKHADRVMQELQAAAAEFLNERDLSSELTGDVVAIQRGYKEFYDTLSAGLTELCKSLKEKREALARSEAEWAEKYKQARKKRDGALEKLGNHKAVTQQIIKLREEATQLTNKIGDVETKLRVQEEPSVVLKEALAKLRQANRNRDTRTQEWAREIQKLSNEKIKATVIEDGDASEIREAVDILAARTGSQEAARASRLEEALNSNTAVEVVDQLLEDCLHLLHWRLLGEAAGDERPSCEFLMKILGNTEKIRAAVTERLDTTRVEALATAVSRPKIALSYCDGSREISFEKASDGQRAAALLFMLLEQPGGPLIIDQPEGDLDNKIIAELTEKLHDAKQRRQLIFASHNSNIVVNGSAELVGYLEVDVTGTRQFECAGAIDVPRIREVITETMEGGEKAFKDRYDKYGY